MADDPVEHLWRGARQILGPAIRQPQRQGSNAQIRQPVAATTGQRIHQEGARWLNHLPLLLVVEGQAEGVAEGHKGPLHGVGLRLLDGGFVGLPLIHVDAVASAAALAGDSVAARGADRDSNPGGVGDAPAGALFSADGALNAADADHLKGLPIPGPESEDSIGLGNDVPALDV